MQFGMSRSRLLSLILGAAWLAACGSGAEQAPTAETATAPQKPRSAPAVAVDPSQLVELESADFRATLTAQNAALVHYVFKDPRYERGGTQIDLVSTDKVAFLPLGLEIEGVTIPPDATWQAEKLSETAARFTLQAEGLTRVR